MDECPHYLVDQNGVCLDCGLPGNEDSVPLSPEEQGLIKKLPGAGPMIMVPVPWKADIPGIVRLADLTIEQYELELERQKDPDNPDQPRICVIGGLMYRPRWTDIWNQLVSKSYMGAVMLGYRQPLKKWNAFVKDSLQYAILRQSQQVTFPAEQ